MKIRVKSRIKDISGPDRFIETECEYELDGPYHHRIIMPLDPMKETYVDVFVENPNVPEKAEVLHAN